MNILLDLTREKKSFLAYRLRLKVRSRIIYLILIVAMVFSFITLSVESSELSLDDLLEKTTIQNSTLVQDGPEFLFSFELGPEYSQVNNKSGLNPSNNLNLSDNTGELDVMFEISNTFEDNENIRWLLKTMNSYYLESGNTQSNRVDEVFVDYNPGNWFISLGKRRINWGHASAFNSLNVVIPAQNPLNPTPVTEGLPMLWFQYGLENIYIDTIFTRNYDTDWNSDINQWGGSLNINWTYLDTSFYYFDGEKKDNGEVFSRLLGTSFSYDAGAGVVIYAELANFSENNRVYYNKFGSTEKDDGSFDQFVIGFNRTYGLNNSIYVEYFHTESGYTKQQRVNYFNAVDKSLSTANEEEVLSDFINFNMAKNYFSVGYEKLFLNNTVLELGIVYAIDNSYGLRLIGKHDYSDKTTFQVETSYKDGGSSSEFGNSYIKSTIGFKMLYHF